ncbi:hypothetical protein GCM10010387_22620 [Streptomyces inusitatus]|uniref:Uncharacterized protein n=1 Tax=Streptomyces inusitatus TaxID=68221 RepID=A0A918PZP1_9ACTN|nr:hypothetical protein [Streptomyces inusitatus]GGZ28632.1 hypothetical protein GCM10010387_22620 [Streptomyces inusitatus]
MTDKPTAAGGRSPGRPARPADGRAVAAALFVDLGESRGDQWIRQPRARYECLRCRTAEGPVHGQAAVANFTRSIKAEHHSRCTAIQEHSS